MDKAAYRKVVKWLEAGQTVMVRVKVRNPYCFGARKKSKYAGSTLRVVRTTGENRCSLVADELTHSISLHYAELILLDETLPMTQVIRRPDPTPKPKMPSWATEEVKVLEKRITALKELRA